MNTKTDLCLPKTILFDWDNTLVDTWPIIHKALVDTFEEMGHEPWTLDYVKRNVKKSMRDSFPELFGEGWEKAAEIYQNAYRVKHFSGLCGLPEVEDMLSLLQSSSIQIGVVSNKIGMQLRKEVSHMGWDKYFATVVGASDAKRDKPSADPAILALENMNQLPSEDIWFVGDTDVDIHCAINAGLFPVFYGSGEFAEADDMPSFRLHVASHNEMMNIINSLKQN